MDLYSQKSKSIPQKTIIILVELIFIVWSYFILFGKAGTGLIHKTGVVTVAPLYTSHLIIFCFTIIAFFRLTFMMIFLLKRKIPWEESISIPIAFALYYVGYAFLVQNRQQPVNWVDYVAIILFVLGSFLNTFSELQRHFWKKQPANKGKLYTKGLFGMSMHINYFGDLLWVSAYAIVTRNPFAIVIPVFLFCFFAFYNIPKLDEHLSRKYPAQFAGYKKSTRKFIPFIY